MKNKGIQLPLIFALLNPFTAASSPSPWAGAAVGSEPALKSSGSQEVPQATLQEADSKTGLKACIVSRIIWLEREN